MYFPATSAANEMCTRIKNKKGIDAFPNYLFTNITKSIMFVLIKTIY